MNILRELLWQKVGGEKGVFYNPGYRLKREVYVLTVKEKDAEHNTDSNLNRALSKLSLLCRSRMNIQ